jgi:hypothetical protein
MQMPQQQYLGLVYAESSPGAVTPGPRVEIDPTTRLLTFVDPVAGMGAKVGNALVPGVWYPAGGWTITAGVALAVNVLRAVPFENNNRPFEIDRLAFNITSIGGAGSRVRIGIYRAQNGIGLPTSLLVDAGEEITDGGAADTRVKTFASVTLTDPLYWFVYIAGTSGPTVRAIVATNGAPVFGVSQTDLGTASRQTHWTVAQAYGALPVNFPGGGAFAADNYPIIACRGV